MKMKPRNFPARKLARTFQVLSPVNPKHSNEQQEALMQARQIRTKKYRAKP